MFESDTAIIRAALSDGADWAALRRLLEWVERGVRRPRFREFECVVRDPLWVEVGACRASLGRGAVS